MPFRHSKVLLVGDKNQLPSIGPGNVLMDMLAAKVPNVNRQRFSGSQRVRVLLTMHKINAVKCWILNQKTLLYFKIARKSS